MSKRLFPRVREVSLRGVLGVALVLGCVAVRLVDAQLADRKPAVPWWRGNLHTHSLWSDGDDYPEMIVDWYKRQGYHFLGLSDHNVLSEGERWIDAERNRGGALALAKYRERFKDWVQERRMGDTHQVRLRPLSEFRTLFEEPGRFLMIQMEELTDRFENKPVHINVTNIRELIRPQGGSSVAEVIQRNFDAVEAQRKATRQPMFPHLNHPNFGWGVTAEDMMNIRGERFFEVYNGHPAVHNYGDASRPGAERIWDILLAHRLPAGHGPLYGLAVDDSHNYHLSRVRLSNPGRGWVMVRSPQLTPEQIVAAMERGDFYASTGVTLRDIRLENRKLSLEIQPEPGVTYTTQFIGTRKGFDTRTEPVTIPASGKMPAVTLKRYSAEIGQVLAEVPGTSPSYRLRGDELYVRARVVSSRVKVNPYQAGDLETAWTQPVTLAR